MIFLLYISQLHSLNYLGACVINCIVHDTSYLVPIQFGKILFTLGLNFTFVHKKSLNKNDM